MKTINKRLLATAVAAALALPTAAFATNGYFAHGYGTKNKGLGGAGVALPQDSLAAATNPAGMAFIGERMDVGAALFSPNPRGYDASDASGTTGCDPSTGACTFTLGTNGSGQAIESEDDIFVVPHFGYNWVLDQNSTVGLSVYGNGGMNTEYKGGQANYNPGTGFVNTDGTFGGGTAGVNLEQLFVGLTYARKYSDTGAWGVTPILAYQRFEAKGLGTLAGFSSDPGSLSDNGTDSSSGFGLKLGIKDEVAPGLTLGASYQSKMSMSKFDDYKGLFAEEGDFDIPATWTLGLAYDMGNSSTILFDIQKIMYSDIDSIANPISPLQTSCSPGPTGGTGSGCLGASGGAGFGWEDITVYKLGYQWSTNADWTWRVGFNHGDQPIPDSEVLFNILAPGVMEDHFTFGFTKNTGADSEFNFAAMYAPENTVTGKNAFNPNQEIELEMTQWELEASWAWKF